MGIAPSVSIHSRVWKIRNPNGDVAIVIAPDGLAPEAPDCANECVRISRRVKALRVFEQRWEVADEVLRESHPRMRIVSRS